MNRIITDKCKSLKALAKQALKTHWAEAIVFALVCQLIMQLPGLIYNLLPIGFDKLGFVAMLINFYVIIITGPITLSLIAFYLRLFRQEKLGGLKDLRFGFTVFPKAIILYIRQLLFTWLWSMLFIIPGIIAAIAYSQSFFILADDPSKSPAKCMLESKFIMQGNKWKFAKLLLSFIGWYIIATIPAVLCHSILDAGSISLMAEALASGDINAASSYAVTVSPIVDILLLFTTFVSVYVNTSKAVFFDILVGRLVIKNVDQFADIEVEAEAV